MSAEDHRVNQVRTICQTAMGCAKAVAQKDPAENAFAYERQTYQRRKLRAIQVTSLIADRLQFEMALRSIIDLCMAAAEIDDAGKLLGMIANVAVREEILRSHPILQLSARGRRR